MKAFNKSLLIALSLLSIQGFSVQASTAKPSYRAFESLVNRYGKQPNLINAVQEYYASLTEEGDIKKADILLAKKGITLEGGGTTSVTRTGKAGETVTATAGAPAQTEEAGTEKKYKKVWTQEEMKARREEHKAYAEEAKALRFKKTGTGTGKKLFPAKGTSSLTTGELGLMGPVETTTVRKKTVAGPESQITIGKKGVLVSGSARGLGEEAGAALVQLKIARENADQDGLLEERDAIIAILRDPSSTLPKLMMKKLLDKYSDFSETTKLSITRLMTGKRLIDNTIANRDFELKKALGKEAEQADTSDDRKKLIAAMLQKFETLIASEDQDAKAFATEMASKLAAAEKDPASGLIPVASQISKPPLRRSKGGMLNIQPPTSTPERRTRSEKLAEQRAELNIGGAASATPLTTAATVATATATAEPTMGGSEKSSAEPALPAATTAAAVTEPALLPPASTTTAQKTMADQEQEFLSKDQFFTWLKDPILQNPTDGQVHTVNFNDISAAIFTYRGNSGQWQKTAIK